MAGVRYRDPLVQPSADCPSGPHETLPATAAAPRRQSLGGRDPHASHELLIAPGNLSIECVQLGLDPLRSRCGSLACRRKCIAMGRSVEQPHAQPPLEIVQASENRGCVDIEAFCSSRERAGASKRQHEGKILRIQGVDALCAHANVSCKFADFFAHSIAYCPPQRNRSRIECRRRTLHELLRSWEYDQTTVASRVAGLARWAPRLDSARGAA